MTNQLAVQTDFNDVVELSQGLGERLDANGLILYGPHAYRDGTEVPFVVLYSNGNVAFEGIGVVEWTVDGGAERDPEVRYDLLLGRCRFSKGTEKAYKIAMEIRGVAPVHAPVAIPEAGASFDAEEAESFATQKSAWSSPPGTDELDVSNLSEMQSSDAPASAFAPDRMLSRPSRPPSWQPAVKEPPAARSSSGLFDFGLSGLPFPEHPPRPDINPASRIVPAPRPPTSRGGQES